eukprot:4763643-Pleurochrysis_carterae.AAC.2
MPWPHQHAVTAHDDVHRFSCERSSRTFEPSARAKSKGLRARGGRVPVTVSIVGHGGHRSCVHVRSTFKCFACVCPSSL